MLSRRSLTRSGTISSSSGEAGRESRPVIEVRIDRRDGSAVTVDDCARASRALEARLDGSELVSPQYVLQVSSPGERPLRNAAEWRRFVGRWANVLSPEHGGRFEGEIVAVEGECGVGSRGAGAQAGRSSAASRWLPSRRRGWRFICNRHSSSEARRRSRAATLKHEGSGMVSSAEILAAFREVSNSKQLDRAELYALLQDGILAALAKKYGPNVQAEVNIDDGKGDIRIVLLKTVVANVEDSSREISLEDARTFDDSFEVGDVHGRADRLRRLRTRRRPGRQAAHHPARPRRRAHAHPRRVRDARRRPALRRSPADRARQARRHAQQVPRSGSDHSVSRAEPPRALSTRASRFAPCSSASRRRPRVRASS